MTAPESAADRMLRVRMSVELKRLETALLDARERFLASGITAAEHNTLCRQALDGYVTAMTGDTGKPTTSARMGRLREEQAIAAAERRLRREEP